MNWLKSIDWSNPIPKILAFLAFIAVLALAGAGWNKYETWKGNRRAAGGTRITTTNKISNDRWKGPEAWYRFRLWLEPEQLADFQEAAWKACLKFPDNCNAVRSDYHAAMERANLGCVLDKSKCGVKKARNWTDWLIGFGIFCIGCICYGFIGAAIKDWIKK